MPLYSGFFLGYTRRMIEEIREKQPHIVVNLGDTVNVIALADLRMIMNDLDNDLLTRCLCKAVLDLLEN